MTETVEIDKDEYARLLRRDITLRTMERVGVDNWQGMDFFYENQVDIINGIDTNKVIEFDLDKNLMEPDRIPRD